MSKLAEIFAAEREAVARQKRELPLAELEVAIAAMPAPLGFQRALESSPFELALIAEVKRSSPSAGVIRADFDPVEVAAAYRDAGAECLSVLTNEPYFGGRPEYLALCKTESGLPCLRKDFLDDPYQLAQARAWGADAALLIVAALEPAQLRDLLDVASGYGLDVLTEVHTEAEAEIALAAGCRMIGVNNRDLANFETSVTVSERILPRVAPHALAVSESALDSPEDLERVRAAGARAVLIGTAFCSAPDVRAKVREVMGR